MNKQALLYHIAYMVFHKRDGEAHLHTFDRRARISEQSYLRARKMGQVHYYVSDADVNHGLYEIFSGENKRIIISTYSYTLPADALTANDLKLIYGILRQECTCDERF